MDDSVSMREARANLARLLDQAEEGEPTVITRGGTPVAAIVPIEEYNALEKAADEVLARKALRTLQEEGDAPRASLADVLADIFGPPSDASSTGAA
ncbi:type II toxin-antitoxin system Phd/YefM family antitoxin [Streptomyces sp. NPDC001165]|uniref:type II toxin-antitoxin system Phd/YefM family antitoxin n=1 Tax=Streptomyces sp. NPDC001165 TaxID=3364546 RepID=UPI003677BE6D